MKPVFAGFMAVEQSRIMRCGCRERVLERTAPLREALPAWRLPPPEACGRNDQFLQEIDGQTDRGEPVQ